MERVIIDRADFAVSLRYHAGLFVLYHWNQSSLSDVCFAPWRLDTDECS